MVNRLHEESTCSNRDGARQSQQRGRYADGSRNGQIPVISGFPKPLPTQWSKRVRVANPIFATFRPLFRLGVRRSASIPCDHLFLLKYAERPLSRGTEMVVQDCTNHD